MKSDIIANFSSIATDEKGVIQIFNVGADPATASSIFLATATNVVSMGLLLGLAALPVK